MAVVKPMLQSSASSNQDEQEMLSFSNLPSPIDTGIERSGSIVGDQPELPVPLEFMDNESGNEEDYKNVSFYKNF